MRFIRKRLAEPAKAFWGFSLKRVNEPLVVRQRATEIIRPGYIEKRLQISSRIKCFFKRPLRQIVVPIEAWTDRNIGAKKRRLRCETKQGKLPARRMPGKYSESVCAVRLLDGWNEFGGQEALEIDA